MAVKFMCMLFGSHLSFLCVDLKLEMYEMGVPKGCVVVLYFGCGEEFGVVEGGVGWWCVLCIEWYVVCV
jgi:hypothetical protein